MNLTFDKTISSLTTVFLALTKLRHVGFLQDFRLSSHLRNNPVGELAMLSVNMSLGVNKCVCVWCSVMDWQGVFIGQPDL